jgi:hypothetical protein
MPNSSDGIAYRVWRWFLLMLEPVKHICQYLRLVRLHRVILYLLDIHFTPIWPTRLLWLWLWLWLWWH